MAGTRNEDCSLVLEAVNCHSNGTFDLNSSTTFECLERKINSGYFLGCGISQGGGRKCFFPQQIQYDQKYFPWWEKFGGMKKKLLRLGGEFVSNFFPGVGKIHTLNFTTKSGSKAPKRNKFLTVFNFAHTLFVFQYLKLLIENLPTYFRVNSG
jgi:hypothetical protein